MRYGIFSDVHANLEAFSAVIQAYKQEEIDRYLCVGDIVGYGANPNECIREIKQLDAVTVAGNHDWASVDLFSTDYFNPFAKDAVLWTRLNLAEEQRRFLESLGLVFKFDRFCLVHGTLEEPEEFNYLTNAYVAERSFGLLEKNICFIGHTHVLGVFTKSKDSQAAYQETGLINIEAGNKYIINVGSVGQPRDGNPAAAYSIYDTEKNTVELKRINYDFQAARQKIIAAGLPKFLGDRLLAGR